MTQALIEKFGASLAMLYTAKDTDVRVELMDGEQWQGTVVNVDEAGNVELANARQLAAATTDDKKSNNTLRQAQSLLIRGGSIIYVALLDVAKLEALWPMLKTVQRAK